ncbi:MAG TPA: protein-L-isoaspartate O-methyltransferase [Rhodanobacteraceae bacterium]|nr:protein-L-isoaspartate O-methyltransferase [Rhodanobacteraceae bacterium]
MLTNADLARQNMIENQVRPWEVLDPRVLDVLAAVRREDFVPARYRNLAFADMALPIGHGESMMKPTVEGRLLQSLALTAEDRVLEIGTGSGFVTACLSRLARSVDSVEIHADLAEAARVRVVAAGARNVRIVAGDAIRDFDAAERYDAVVVTGAVYALPDRLRGFVAPRGRLFAIVGESPAMQATLYTRADDTHWREESLFETDLAYLTHAEPPRRFSL